MSLDAAARRRFARHLLLAEIGEPGQERLMAAGFCQTAESDADAYRAAAEYLERAGSVPRPSGAQVCVPDSHAVERFAGATALRKPAALIAGAFAAVEHIKDTLGIAAARPFPAELSLSNEH